MNATVWSCAVAVDRIDTAEYVVCHGCVHHRTGSGAADLSVVSVEHQFEVVGLLEAVLLVVVMVLLDAVSLVAWTGSVEALLVVDQLPVVG